MQDATPTAPAPSTTSAPVPSSSAANAPSDVLAYWPFDGNANDAVGRWHGLQRGTIGTADRNNIGNAALLFDGGSYVDFGALHPPITAFSVSFWMRPATLTTNGSYQNENEIIGDAGGNRGFRLMQIHSTIYFQAQGGGSQAEFNMAPSDLSRWIHVGATYDGRTSSIYRDGRLQQATAGGTMLVGALSLQIGRDVNLGASYWRGALDEVRIYGRALSSSEMSILAR